MYRPKPDRINFDQKTGTFYKNTPFGQYDITDFTINTFFKEIMEKLKDNENSLNLISAYTEQRIINPLYFSDLVNDPNGKTKIIKLTQFVLETDEKTAATLVNDFTKIAESSILKGKIETEKKLMTNPTVQLYLNQQNMQITPETKTLADYLVEKQKIEVYGGNKQNQ
jgi:hypothetical protein